MKIAGSIGKIVTRKVSEPKIVHHIAVIGGWKKLDNPTLSNELECLICKGKEYTTWPIDQNNPEIVWFCKNSVCAVTSLQNCRKATTTQVVSRRAFLWPLFCEINDIGDKAHDICFEKIDQSAAKLEFLAKFVSNPEGIIFMQGKPGLGKTYAALGVCEFLTRKHSDVYFTTHRGLFQKWLENNTTQKYENYFRRIKEAILLVIDDFGVCEPSPGFMSFFMDLINSRRESRNRGTIITTNIDKKMLSEICGDSLMDRLNTGQQFKFEGESRRKKPIL
jgi:hypothetical protein